MCISFLQDKLPPPVPPKPKSRIEETKNQFEKLATNDNKPGYYKGPSAGKQSSHAATKDKPGPTMRKKSMKKKKMTDEEIMAALSKISKCT